MTGSWRDVVARLRRDGNEVVFNVAHDEDVIPLRDVASLIEKQAAEIERLREGLHSVINAADSFCDCEGDEVAGQVRIRASAALSAKGYDNA